MERINRDELLALLTGTEKNHLNFALEIENTVGAKNCVFVFREAFRSDSHETSDEFMAVFADSVDLIGEIHISVNAYGENFIGECADKIYQVVKSCGCQEVRLVLHATDRIKLLVEQKYKDMKFLNGGEKIHSFYCNSDVKAKLSAKLKIRMLDEYDEFFCTSFESDNEDDYLSTIFDYSIRNPKYRDCGIAGCFGSGGELTGYLAYYGLDESIRDVSYIYVGKNYRNSGYGKALLNFFRNRNIDDGKISYYSYPENEHSEKLARSCGFTPCSFRYEYDIASDM